MLKDALSTLVEEELESMDYDSICEDISSNDMATLEFLTTQVSPIDELNELFPSGLQESYQKRLDREN